ncbi:hypothetical protein OPIT5_29960 [Opitutaceae bacterium TAV5]|nr:hypothetical protein OPIT5_29960 [Opitutaceae bacterium TAV5]
MSPVTTKEIIDDLLLLVAQSENLHPDAQGKIRVLLSGLRRELMLMRQRCLRPPGAYKVAVVGLGNVGKSTLLNALLGMKIAPVSNAPCTANIVEFNYGPDFRLMAEAQGRLMPQHWTFPQPASLHEQLSKMVAHDGGTEREWNRLEVTLPADILSGGLILADTPGFGVAGEVGQHDNEVIAGFLKNDVAQIFWVVMADQGIGRQELAFYHQYLVDRCDDLVVTNAEDWEPEDRKRWEQRFAPQLRSAVQIHFVKGKQARLARERQDIEGWEESGAADVCRRIGLLKHADGRLDGVNRNLALLGEILCRNLQGTGIPGRVFCPLANARLLRKYADEPAMLSWMRALSKSGNN